MAAAQRLGAQRVGAAYDLWDDGGKEKSGVAAGVVSRKRRRAAAHAPMYGTTAAEQVPRPGSSYNPSYDDHQDLLGLAVVREVADLEREERFGKRLRRPVAAGAAADPEPAPSSSEDESEKSSGEDENGGDSMKMRGKLTKAQLNRRARARLAEVERLEQKRRKSAERELDRAPQIVRELKNRDDELERRAANRQATKTQRDSEGPPGLGVKRFVPPKEDVLLSDELKGSLRELRTCSTELLQNRVKSLQQRGIVEVVRSSDKKKKGRRRARVVRRRSAET